MDKVYVVYSVVDPWCGYYVEKIFNNEEAAKGYVEYFNSHDKMAINFEGCRLDYFEEELLDNFVVGGK